MNLKEIVKIKAVDQHETSQCDRTMPRSCAAASGCPGRGFWGNLSDMQGTCLFARLDLLSRPASNTSSIAGSLSILHQMSSNDMHSVLLAFILVSLR